MCKHKSGLRDPARKCTMPTRRGKGRRDVSGVRRAAGHKGTKTGEVSENEMRRAGAQHIPCWGKIGPERERKQMRGPSRETRGNSRHSRGEQAGKHETARPQGDHRSVWLCTKIQGDREEVDLCPAAPNQMPRSYCPSTCQQKAT